MKATEFRGSYFCVIVNTAARKEVGRFELGDSLFLFFSSVPVVMFWGKANLKIHWCGLELVPRYLFVAGGHPKYLYWNVVTYSTVSQLT